VQIQSLSQELAEAYELDRPRGAFVADVVAGSPAKKAGVVVEDIILKFNDKVVLHADALPPLVGSVVPGSSVKMVVLRNGKEKTLSVTIDALEQDKQVASANKQPVMPENNASRLGVVVADANDEELAALEVEFGVVVTSVEPGSAAAEAGVRSGDVIASLNRRAIDSTAKLGEVLSAAEAGKSLPLRVYRKGTAVFMAVTLPVKNG